MPVEQWKATVTANDDPQKRGRIRVTCPALLDANDDEAAVREGEQPEPPELPDWIEPSFFFAANYTGRTSTEGRFSETNQPAGFFFVPRIGDQVVIEMDTDADDLELEERMTWRFALYPTTDDVPAMFQGVFSDEIDQRTQDLLYTRIWGFFSYEGHGLVMLDVPPENGGALFLLQNANTATTGLAPERFLVMGEMDGFDDPVFAVIDKNQNQLSIEESGRIILNSAIYGGTLYFDDKIVGLYSEPGSGHELEMVTDPGAGEDYIRMLHRNGGVEFYLDEDRIFMEDSHGEVVELNTSGGPSQIYIGSSATEPLVLGTQLQTILNSIMTFLLTHVHEGPGHTPPDGFTGGLGTVSASGWATLTALIAGTTWLSDLAKTKK